MEQNYTYILQCADGTLYCGWTNHLNERVRAHNEGRGAKYTKSRRPVTLVYYEAFATRQEAMKREWAIKQMTRAKKQALIRQGASVSEEQEKAGIFMKKYDYVRRSLGAGSQKAWQNLPGGGKT